MQDGSTASVPRHPPDASKSRRIPARELLTGEQLAAMRAAWTQAPAHHAGPRFPFGPVWCEPRPTAPPAMWFGGERLIAGLLERGVLNDGRRIDYAFGITHGTYRGLATVGHGERPLRPTCKVAAGPL